jgi:L-cystine uptake protein TcyP (sodium:dicarboxylate symporter family)
MEEIKSISGYILGIVSLVLSFFNPVPGIILGIVGLVQSSSQKDKLSKKGKILNISAIAISLIMIVFALLVSLGIINFPKIPEY